MQLSATLAGLGTTAPPVQALHPGTVLTVPVSTDMAVGDIRPELTWGLRESGGMLTAEVSGDLQLRDYCYSLVAERRGDTGSTDSGPSLRRPPSLQHLLWALAMHGLYNVGVENVLFGQRITVDGGVLDLTPAETAVDLRACTPEAALLIRRSVAVAIAAAGAGEK